MTIQRPFQRGSKLTAADLNELRKVALQSQSLRGDGFINVVSAPNGRTLKLSIDQVRAALISPATEDERMHRMDMPFGHSLEGPEWSGGAPPPAVGEYIQLFRYSQTTVAGAIGALKTSWWQPVRAGMGRRVRAYLNNDLATGNEVGYWMAFKQAGATLPSHAYYPLAIAVTGTITPDATGTFERYGTLNSYPYWKSDTTYTAQSWSPYLEDFNDGVADDFAVGAGTWSVPTTRYYGYPAAAGGDNTFAESLVGLGAMPDSFTVSCVVNMDAAAGGYYANALIIYDWQDANNFKYAGIYQGSSKLVIGAVVGGVRQAWVATATFSSSAGTDYTMTAVIRDTAISVTVGAVTKSYDWGASITSGSVGVGTNNAKAYFDDFSVTDNGGSYYLYHKDSCWFICATLDEAPGGPTPKWIAPSGGAGDPGGTTYANFDGAAGSATAKPYMWATHSHGTNVDHTDAMRNCVLLDDEIVGAFVQATVVGTWSFTDIGRPDIEVHFEWDVTTP